MPISKTHISIAGWPKRNGRSDLIMLPWITIENWVFCHFPLWSFIAPLVNSALMCKSVYIDLCNRHLWRCAPSHDQMCDLMGVNAQSFETRNSAKVMELKRLIIDHVKALHALLHPAIAQSDAVSDVVSIPVGEDSFPLVLMPWNGEVYTKKQLEELFRAYLGQHYCECRKVC